MEKITLPGEFAVRTLQQLFDDFWWPGWFLSGMDTSLFAGGYVLVDAVDLLFFVDGAPLDGFGE